MTLKGVACSLIICSFLISGCAPGFKHKPPPDVDILDTGPWWCPPLKDWVEDPEDCPGSVEGMYFEASPPQVMVRGNNVDGSFEITAGSESASYSLSFLDENYNRIEKLNPDVHFVMFKIKDKTKAGWKYEDENNPHLLRGKFTGNGAGTTTVRVWLCSGTAESYAVVYKSPKIQIVVK